MRLTRTEFQDLAERCLREIPREFLDLLYNVGIEVKDAPGEEAGRWRGSRTLLGLYTGLDRAAMLATTSGTYEPAAIVLYQENIESQARSAADLERLVRTTLRHELAHHFGFSDRDLRKRWPEGA